MSELVANLRYAVRSLGARPGFSLLCILTLAVGIGANTTAFTGIWALVLQPLPYPQADRLVALWSVEDHDPRMPVTLPDFFDWRARSRALSEIAAYRPDGYPVRLGGGDPEWLGGVAVSSGFFSLLGVEVGPGRAFTALDDRPQGPPVALVTESFWRSRLGGRPSAIGETIEVAGRPVELIGVVRTVPWLPNLSSAEVVLPLSSLGELLEKRSLSSNTLALGRLAPGATVEGARAEMEAVAARLGAEHPDTNSHRTVGLAGLGETLTEPLRVSLFIAWAAAAAVLLISCVNVANLMLARTADRRDELVVRRALGAGSGALLRQLATEGLLLAAAAALLGGLGSLWAVDALALRVDSPLAAAALRIDPTVLLYTTVVTVVTGLGIGLLPALRAPWRRAATTTRPDAARGHAAAPRAVRVLAAVEIALALVLTLTAGLLVRSFLELRRVDPGFDTAGILTAFLYLPEARYPGAEERGSFHDRLLAELEAVPGVERAALVTPLPLSGSTSATSIEVDGWTDPAGDRSPSLQYTVTTPGYFEMLGISVLSGRGFDVRDREGGARTALVDRAMADRFWPGEEALGKTFVVWGERRTVVGVVDPVRSFRLFRAAEPRFYLPLAQNPVPWTFVAVHAAGSPEALATPLRRTVAGLDGGLALADVRSFDAVRADSMSSHREPTLFLGGLAALALALALLGVYGVFSYAVSRRTREIGVRMALGADPGRVQREVVASGLALALTGAGVGGLAMLIGGRLLGSLLYGVASWDPATYLTAIVLLLAMATVACWAPARRAARIDPVESLRDV